MSLSWMSLLLPEKCNVYLIDRGDFPASFNIGENNMKKTIKNILSAWSTVSFLSLSLATLSFYSTSSLAGTVTGNMQSTASVGSNCVVGATNINFGTMTLNAVRNYANGNINVLCTNKSAYTITLSFNTQDPNNVGNGLMTGSAHGDVIVYSITSTPAGSYAWGLQKAVTGTGNGQTQNYPTYGVALTGIEGHSAYPVPDSYSDMVTATISY